MAVINGDSQKRVILSPNVETIVQFGNAIQNICLHVSGGLILFKVGGTISGVDDLTANTITDGCGYDMYKDERISEIHFYSANAVTIQWDTP